MTFWSVLLIVIGVIIIAFMIIGSEGVNDDFLGVGCGCGCWFILVGVVMLFAFVIGAGVIVIF